MAENSKIEWCDHTANLWWGCTEVHEGCDNCYARTLSKRWGFDVWGNTNMSFRRPIKSVWKDLDRFQKIASEKNEMHRVFVGSMMDIFEKPMLLLHGEGMETSVLRNILFGNISLGKYPNLIFLFLTKRPSNINKYIPESWKVNPPSNVMFGTSPVNQKTFDTLVPQLAKVNGKRFLSIEPQLEFVTFDNSIIGVIDWIIQGGESGAKKRPFNIGWAYKMMGNCAVLGIPYFFKQIDKVQPIPEDLMIRQFPKINQ